MYTQTNNSTNPGTTPGTTFPICNAPNVNEVWRGLGGHFRRSDQILEELVDNALSNFRSHSGAQGVVRITLQEQDDGMVEVTVEDNGSGIVNLNNALTLAGKDIQETVLNEHGFGLKHALAAANPENDHWRIITRTAADANQKRARKVEAPYFVGDSYGAYIPSWPGTLGDTGTIITFRCTRALLDSIMDGPDAPNLPHTILDVAERLVEELGYVYAPILEAGELSIFLSCREKGTGDKQWPVVPVVPVWKMNALCNQSIRKDLGGGEITLKLRYGEITSNGVGHHYLCNQETSGVEIRINGRLLEHSLYKKIFGGKKHNSQNAFLCQVDLITEDQQTLPATNPTKTHLKESDPKVAKLYAWIKATVPKCGENEGKQERILFERLAQQKRTHMPQPCLVGTERYAFSSLNEKIRMDLFVSYNGEVTIYEGKRRSTSPKDLYQLRMYWDGCVADGTPPERAVLLGSRHPESVRKIVDMINAMQGPDGRFYHFEVKTWAEEGIDPNDLTPVIKS